MSLQGSVSSGPQQQQLINNPTLSSIDGQKQSCIDTTPPGSRPSHEDDHVRKGRLSTSDARKTDHNVSSRIVSLSSATVMPQITTSKRSVQQVIAAGGGSRAGNCLDCASSSVVFMSYNALPKRLITVQVFNEKHASSHLGIPLGAIITPSLPHCQPKKAQHEPVCCSSCDAFLNMYSEVACLLQPSKPCQ